MRAVWSFWSRPFQARKNIGWYSELHHLLAWGLSLQTASRHYPETVLITDRSGKRLLVEQLGLPFVHVSTELERLAEVDSGWWALGKLMAYSIQDQPFIHIDTDAFLWKPLPRHLTESPVLALCPVFYANDSNLLPLAIERAFAERGGKLPVEWEWARSRGNAFFREEACGILGGCHVAFLRYYAETAVSLVLNSDNAAAWSRLPDKISLNTMVEQFLLGACIDYHRFHPASPYRSVNVKHLFSSVEKACDINQAARLGHTHLLGGSKSHPAVARHLEERVRRENPAYFRRCEQVLVKADRLLQYA
jgi:hypothetical protein